MNSNLASRLLTSVMEWNAIGLTSERPILEFMGSMKYDAYDRYMPGTRFMSSLVQWLNQFDEEDRSIVLDFIKKNLIFISSTQMNYLVDLLYDSNIRPILQRKATTNAKKPSYMLCNKEVQKQFDIEKRSALIIGLSDGAHTDILRRSAGFNNEQVLTNYYPDSKKMEELLDKLTTDLKKKGCNSKYFRSIFLIDDFTASGKSFVRYDEKEKEYKGKLIKIIDELCKEPEEKDKFKHLSALLDPEQTNIYIYIMFCMATEKAKTNIEKGLKDYKLSRSFKKNVIFEIYPVQMLENDITNDITGNEALMKVLKKTKYLNKGVKNNVDYQVGQCKHPYLGFDECALPVVLSHNTPNNSLPILWQDTDDDNEFRGLFPRISRH